jgi:hypothetical protein
MARDSDFREGDAGEHSKGSFFAPLQERFCDF